MGDDDELRLPRQAPHVPGVPGDVHVVQGRLNLVHDAEGRGVDLQDGEVQGDGHKGLLSAGQQGDGFQSFPRRLGLDLNAAVQDVLRVLQLQLGLSAAEHLDEGGLEALVQKLELLGENPGHLPGDAADDALQVRLGLFHVVPLVR